jgi:hypothetical protein
LIEDELGFEDKIWKTFLRRHWKISIVFLIAIIAVIIGAILVFLWFAGDAQATGLVPATLDLWTMGYLITFLLYLLLWEFLLVGIPVIVVVAAVYFLWWRRLPEWEREEYKRENLFFGRSSKRSNGGNAITFLVNVLFILKVYIDGNWDVPFADWTFDYLVNSYVFALVLVLVIFGIPAILGVTWWVRREM